MARQDGIIKLNGRIGDLSFYKTKNGYQAREKGGVSADRIATDPRYQRTRENGAEFGRATKAGKVLRTAFKGLTNQLADKRISNRLMKVMLQVIQADSVNDRGMRMVLDDEAEMLKGFEFNTHGLISSTIHVAYTATIDRSAGTGVIDFPAFSARDFITSPRGATHFKFSAALANVDFETGVYELNEVATAMVDVRDVAVAASSLSCQITAGTVKPLFLLLGIGFYQQVNGQDYSLSNGTYNGLAIAQVQGL